MADQAIDYSKLSDDDLNKLVLQKQAQAQASKPAAVDYSSMSDDELNKAVLAKAAGSKPASSPDQALPTDLYKGDTNRAAASFGNDQGRESFLKGLGYKAVSTDKDGKTIALGPDGKWYKDNDNFFSKGSGLAGYIPDHPINAIESSLGSALPAVGMGAGAVSGGIPGAMGGAAGGELLRQAAGKYYGTYKGGALDSAADATKEALVAGSMEGIGKAVSPVVSPYIDTAWANAKGLGKGAVARTSELLTGVPREAIERLIDRPSQVMGASTPENILATSKSARDELLDRDATEDNLISRARDKAVADSGDVMMDTSKYAQKLAGVIDKNAPVDGIQGAFSPSQFSDLLRLRDEALAKDGAQSRTFKDMQKLTDELSTKIDFDRSQLPGGSRYQGTLASLRGQIKGGMHDVSPELAAADSRFSNYADKSSLVGRLENEATMESFINNYFGRNKGMMRSAAEQLIPGSADKVADIGAEKAFSVSGPAGSDFGRRSGAGLIAGSGIAGAMHSPLGIALGLGAASSTSPALNKAVIGGVSKAMEAIPEQMAPIATRAVINLAPQELGIARKFISNNRFLTNTEKAKASDSVNKYGEIDADLAKKAAGGQLPPQMQQRVEPDKSGAIEAAVKKQNTKGN